MKRGKVIFWIILSLAVVGVVLTVLFITLFGNKNTDTLGKSFNSYSTSQGYLSKEGDRFKKIDSYLENLDAKLASGDAREEVKNFRNFYDACTTISYFFNNEIYFMQYNETYKKENNSIVNNLKGAQKEADKFVEQIEKNKNVAADSEFWNEVAWTNCRGYMSEITAKTLDVFNSLAKIYKDCVESNLMNNNFSNAMFVCMNALGNDVKTNAGKTAGVGQKMLIFANAYFDKNKETQILAFAYEKDESKIAKVENIVEKGAESDFYTNFIAGSL